MIHLDAKICMIKNNIVATMLENNIKDLFTHNVKDFERYKELINIIPLV